MFDKWTKHEMHFDFLQKYTGVYGPAIKEVLHEDFGDGVMSAIDYSCKIDKDSAGRVQIVLNGKFLPYNFYKQS